MLNSIIKEFYLNRAYCYPYRIHKTVSQSKWIHKPANLLGDTIFDKDV